MSHWNDQEEYVREFPSDHQTHHIAIDWRTRTWIEETFTVGDDGQTNPEHELVRCLGNAQVASWHPRTEHSREPARWEVVPSGQNGDQLCTERMLPGEKAGNRRSTDGVAPAGLTPAEMDAFLSYLDGVPGLVEVFPPVPVQDAAGRPFLQLDVALNPTDPQQRGNDQRVGVGFLNAAFGQTGKDPEEYAYSIDVEEQQGRRMRYFVDPQTMLPAYATMMITTPQRVNGRPRRTRTCTTATSSTGTSGRTRSTRRPPWPTARPSTPTGRGRWNGWCSNRPSPPCLGYRWRSFHACCVGGEPPVAGAARFRWPTGATGELTTGYWRPGSSPLLNGHAPPA
ncbi:hypothetical protein BJF78_23100 [Pseudonocardia sp. CNS-139]|nr:hypothetical protein BJF78_23100 [Pseudonocardia sp. CNS-139]